jgi:hypothetical protein
LEALWKVAITPDFARDAANVVAQGKIPPGANAETSAEISNELGMTPGNRKPMKVYPKRICR